MNVIRNAKWLGRYSGTSLSGMKQSSCELYLTPARAASRRCSLSLLFSNSPVARRQISGPALNSTNSAALLLRTRVGRGATKVEVSDVKGIVGDMLERDWMVLTGHCLLSLCMEPHKKSQSLVVHGAENHALKAGT